MRPGINIRYKAIKHLEYSYQALGGNSMRNLGTGFSRIFFGWIHALPRITKGSEFFPQELIFMTRIGLCDKCN